MPANPTDYALIIGIDDYPLLKRPLQGAVKDAESFNDWVTNETTGGGVPSKNCRLIRSKIDSPADIIPSQQEIDLNLRDLINHAIENKESHQPRRFYFYFSGHGLGLTSEDIGLCLPVWSENFSANASLKTLGYLDLLKKWGLFKEIFFFLDCCRLVVPFSGGNGPLLTLTSPKESAANSRHLIATTNYNTASYESVTNTPGNGDDNQERGFFTTILIDALTGAAASPEGGVTLGNLIDYLDIEVTKFAEKKNRQQGVVFPRDFSRSQESTIILGSAPPKGGIKSGEAIVFSDIWKESPTRGSSGPLENMIILSESIFKIIKAPGAEDVEITLFDAKNSKKYQGYDSFIKKLPQGEYQIRLRYLGHTRIVTIKHHAIDSVYQVEPFEVQSSILLHNIASSHEYYTYPAYQWSHQMTRSRTIGDASESAIVFFARFLHREYAIECNLFDSFVLLNDQMEVVSSFDSGEVQEDKVLGWFAFSAFATAGQYYLQYNGQTPRIFPVYCFPGWQTQIFLIINENGPVFDSLRLLTAEINQGFLPDDLSAKLTNIAWECLRNSQIEVPPSLYSVIESDILANPLLAISVATILLQRDLPEKKVLLARVMPYLKPFPNIPDVQAIHVLFEQKTTAEVMFLHPPMIAQNTEWLVNRALNTDIRMIVSGSVFEKVSQRRFSDAGITSWPAMVINRPVQDEILAEALFHGIISALNSKIVVDLQWLARYLSIPVTSIQSILKAILDNPNVLNNSFVLKQSQTQPTDARDWIQALNNKRSILYTPTMKKMPLKVVTIFTSDTYNALLELRKEILDFLQDQELVQHWDTDQMAPGTIRNVQIREKISEADLVIGLVSARYLLRSEEAYDMHSQALQQGKQFIPVIVKNCNYDFIPEIVERTPLPRYRDEVLPLSNWDNRADAWKQISDILKKSIL